MGRRRRPWQEVLAAPPTVVSVERLEELWDAWQRMALPPCRQRPQRRASASVRDFTRVEADTGLTMPHEARVWWGWWGAGEGVQVPTGQMFLGLYDALASYRSNLRFAEEMRKEHGDDEFIPTWFWPLESEAVSVGFDLSRHEGDISPLVVLVGTEPNPDPLPVVARSLGEAVEFWIEGINLGYYTQVDHDPIVEYSPMELATGSRTCCLFC